MRCIFHLLLFIPAMAFSQAMDQNALDTLDYEPLLTLFDKHYGDTIAQEKIARTYLKKARVDQDTIKMARAYDRLARIFYSEKGISFADSIIYLTKNSNHNTYPTLGFHLKASLLKLIDKDEESLKNFVIAYQESLKNDNIVLQLSILSNISFLANKWGGYENTKMINNIKWDIIKKSDFRDKVIATFRNPAPIKKEIDQEVSRIYCAHYFDLMVYFIEVKELDSAQVYAKKLIEESNSTYEYIKESNSNYGKEGLVEISYFNKHYSDAIQKIDSFFQKYDAPNSKYRNLGFFNGMSNLALSKREKGINYLLAVDSISTPNSIMPYQISMYDTLYSYYEGLQDFKRANYFLKRKISIDSVFKENYKKVNLAVLEEVLNPIAFQEKDDTIIQLETEQQRSNLLIWILVGIAAIILSAALYYFNRQRQFAKRFLALQLAQKENKTKSKTNKQDRELSAGVAQAIFKHLESFEVDKGFLDSKISLSTLAKEFGTNANYLSRVINLKKEKSFSNYINELRINYALQQLQEDPKFIKYTIKAIAGECGYANADSFSRAFYKQTGMYPSFYIKKLQEEK